jgi:hypothetical protein
MLLRSAFAPRIALRALPQPTFIAGQYWMPIPGQCSMPIDTMPPCLWMVSGLKAPTQDPSHSLQASTPSSRTARSLRSFPGDPASKTSRASLSPEKLQAPQSHGSWLGAQKTWVFETVNRHQEHRSRSGRSLPSRPAAAGRNCASSHGHPRTTIPTAAQSFALLRPTVRPASFSGPIVALAAHPTRWVQLQRGGGEVETCDHAMEFFNHTANAPYLPDFSRLSQLAKSCNGPRFFSKRNLFVAQRETGHVTETRTHSSTKSYPCCQRCIAGGFSISTVKVDKDGSIVLYSNTQEREECEEPRLPLKANEWDEVLKK